MGVNIHATIVINYKDNSIIRCKYLKEVYESIHDDIFKTDVNSAIHTYAEWDRFFRVFFNNEFVKEYHESQYTIRLKEV